jgi:hypothetical protein
MCKMARTKAANKCAEGAYKKVFNKWCHYFVSAHSVFLPLLNFQLVNNEAFTKSGLLRT